MTSMKLENFSPFLSLHVLFVEVVIHPPLHLCVDVTYAGPRAAIAARLLSPSDVMSFNQD